MVLQEMGVGDRHHSEVWCNFRYGDRMCDYRRGLDEVQVERAVKNYPDCEMHEHGYLKAVKTFFGKEWQEWYGRYKIGE